MKRVATLDSGERLAVVETKVDQLMEDGLRQEEKQDELLDEIRKINATMSDLKTEMARYKGWAGGAMFILSGIGVVMLKLAGPIGTWIKTKLGI